MNLLSIRKQIPNYPAAKSPQFPLEVECFCQSRDVAFWKGASGSCNLKVIFDRWGSTNALTKLFSAFLYPSRGTEKSGRK